LPYDGEFAGYRALQRIADAERVKQLLRRAHVAPRAASDAGPRPGPPPPVEGELPSLVVAIDGSWQEVPVRTGYPGAIVGYLTIASVLLDLTMMDDLDRARPADPVAFRQTSEAATIDAALPGSNVVTRTHSTAKDAFREELHDVFHDVVVDSDDSASLLDTFEALLSHRSATREQSCPYSDRGCDQKFVVGPGLSKCPCQDGRPVWSTDALRIHERFNDGGSNGEAFGEVMQVWERILLVHLLRAFERQGLLEQVHRLAFFVDGPLAVFGHPAWLSAAISLELQRLNAEAQRLTGRDLLIVGVEKSGAFVSHFEQLDETEDRGSYLFAPGQYFLPTDSYIKKRIIFSDSPKRYGLDTYFGRKFLYKTASGARVVASIPFLNNKQDTLGTDDVALYPTFGTVCALLDKVASCRYPNSVTPLISAHAQAAIPLHLGAKVLEQLAKALMRKG
jgi:hypothetical protein